MPSERFHNLKQVKKRTFLKMAYREFALHSYEGASITRLVADLKMAKGSIYQYFDDKQDLYNYLVEHAESQLKEVLEKTCPPPSSGATFEEWFDKFLLIHSKFLLAVPSYAFLFLKHEADFLTQSLLVYVKKAISQANEITHAQLPEEEIYSLMKLPLLLFTFIITTEKISPTEIINSDASIDISTDKLLYLCEAFLQKPKISIRKL